MTASRQWAFGKVMIVTLTGWLPVDGLVSYPWGIHLSNALKDQESFTLTHIPSGMNTPIYVSPGQLHLLEELAENLETIGDWSACIPPGEVLATKGRPLLEAIERKGAVLHPDVRKAWEKGG